MSGYKRWGLRYLLPFNLSTKYNLHQFESTYNFADQFVRDDRPIFKGVERSVPASAISRVWNFSKIGGSLIGNAFYKVAKSGFNESIKDAAMDESNIEALTEGLLKMRGAALKIGQFLSF